MTSLSRQALNRTTPWIAALLGLAVACVFDGAAAKANDPQPMNSALKFASYNFPSRVADLGFTVDLPADWTIQKLPEETVDMSDPTVFCPLGVVTAPHAVIVFAFGARPAHADGTLHDWAWYHLKQDQMEPRAVGRGVVAGVAAVIGEAVKPSDFGPMVVRFAFVEDGDRLINLTFAAPELLAGSVNEAWFAMLKSFRLETPKGSRFAIEDHPDLTPAAQIPEPWMEKQAGETPVAAAAEVEDAAATDENESTSDATEASAAQPESKTRFRNFAIDGDTTSLDPETSINANLRDRGIGLVPRILAVDEDDRRATLGAGAIVACIDVPYGWHVLDDGRRTLILEPGNKVQISLNLIPREGRSDDEILDEIEAQMRQDYPAPEFIRVSDGSIRGLGARNIAVNGEAIEQYHLLHPHGLESMVLRARVTTTPEEAANAGNLASLILQSSNHAAAAAAAADEAAERFVETSPTPERQTDATSESTGDDHRPDWWRRALALERQDQLEAAEKVIDAECHPMGVCIQTAEMYRLRMLRLKAAGDAEGALQAFKEADNHMFSYASGATSGGEGAARSYERDQFRGQLVAEYGSDPEANGA